MIALQNATRPKAIAQMVFGVVALAASAIFHREIFPQAGGIGYVVGGVSLLLGIWSWFSAGQREKFVQAAEQTARLTCADHVATGIPNSAPASHGFLTVLAIGLVVIGVISLPIGLLFVAGGAALWWHAKKMSAARAAQGEARFFPLQTDPAVGGELRGEIRMLGGALPPTGPARLSFACRRHVLVKRGKKDSDHIDTENLGETVHRVVEPAQWKSIEGGWAAEVVLPIRGGLPSEGPVPPVVHDKPSVGWYLIAVVPADGREQTLQFIVPVSGNKVSQRPEIPPEMAEAAQDILAPGNPEKVLDFVVAKSVETAEVAAVAPTDVAAVLAAAGIKEVPKYGAVGGHGLQMDPGASQAAQRFMTAGVGCSMILYIGLGFGALFLLAIPYVGWLLALVAIGLLIWAFRSTWAAKQQINRSPELLWVEPGQLCYMAEPDTEWRVPLAEIDRMEIQWIGSSGDSKYVKISAAQPPVEGGTKRERVLLAHGVHGTETARAVIAWLLQKLGASVPVVEAQQGQEQLEKMHDWVKDPTKR